MIKAKLFVIPFLMFFLSGCAKPVIYEIAYTTRPLEMINTNSSRYFEIMVVDSEGQNKRELLDWLGPTERSYIWMPDGESVIFMDIESDQYYIAELGEDPFIACVTCGLDDYHGYSIPSPNGNELVIESANQGIYIFNVEDQTLRHVTNQQNTIFDMSWSPDGEMIALTYKADIYIVEIKNGKTINLTDEIEPAEGRSLAQFSPQWSPNGDKIVFYTDNHLAIIDIDGSNYRDLANWYTSAQYGPRWGYPQWSPDGRKILFTSITGDHHDREGNFEIFMFDVIAGEKQMLTDTPGFDNDYPVWSPDGKQIAFVSKRDGNREIYVMDADGSNQVNLTNSPDYYENDPQWRP